MSPQSSRYPTPAAGDAAEPSGRHRRPESLADARRTSTVVRPRAAFVEDPVVRVGEGRGGSTHVPAPRTRQSRHAKPGRHAAPPARPPVTGSHRAPGTLPIESWLLLGKTRQQVLLASLVAVGLLLIALPVGQKQSGVDAVNAAAERAASTSTAAKKKQAAAKEKSKGDDRPGNGAEAAATPTPAASTAAPGVPVINPSKPAGHAEKNAAGPGNSLRTTGTQAVALTFDDGPDPVQTPRILAMLAKYQVKATFCLVGEQARKHPEIVRQIVAGGHTLCNHTWNHSLTIGKDKPEKIRDDLARTNAAIRAAVPDAKIPFFRAPGGNFSDRLVSVAGETAMTSLYWEVDPRDWEHPDGETAAQHIARVIADVRKHVRPGAIVLSHDFNQPDTIAAYEKLLPWLKDHFVLGLPTASAPTSATPPATGPAETPATPDPAAASLAPATGE